MSATPVEYVEADEVRNDRMWFWANGVHDGDPQTTKVTLHRATDAVRAKDLCDLHCEPVDPCEVEQQRVYGWLRDRGLVLVYRSEDDDPEWSGGVCVSEVYGLAPV